MHSNVTKTHPAPSNRALAHFESLMEYEKDCWDTHDALSRNVADFVLLDVRSPDLFAKGHIAGAINLPHGKIIKSKMKHWSKETVFVTYCAGPHCNGALKAAINLARLERPVKLMTGGITGWLDEGFKLKTV